MLIVSIVATMVAVMDMAIRKRRSIGATAAEKAALLAAAAIRITRRNTIIDKVSLIPVC